MAADPSTPSRGRSREPREWFHDAFGPFYVDVYEHRGAGEAERLLARLAERGRLDAPLLDVACGAGRLLEAARARGLDGFGFDLSLPLLQLARRRARERPEESPRLFNADMRRLPNPAASFRTAVLLFTSFGYFASADEDRNALGELARVLVPGGFLTLDYLNAARARRTLVPTSERTSARWRIAESRWIDPAPEGPFVRKKVEVWTREVARPEPAFAYEERVRLYEATALRDVVESAGFEVDEIWGGYDGEPFHLEDSERCIVLARRRRGADAGEGQG